MSTPEIVTRPTYRKYRNEIPAETTDFLISPYGKQIFENCDVAGGCVVHIEDDQEGKKYVVIAHRETDGALLCRQYYGDTYTHSSTDRVQVSMLTEEQIEQQQLKKKKRKEENAQ